MNRTVLTVTIDTDGDGDEMARLLAEYLTSPEHPWLSDYALGPDGTRDDGYDEVGPLVRGIRVDYGQGGYFVHYRRWEES